VTLLVIVTLMPFATETLEAQMDFASDILFVTPLLPLCRGRRMGRVLQTVMFVLVASHIVWRGRHQYLRLYSLQIFGSASKLFFLLHHATIVYDFNGSSVVKTATLCCGQALCARGIQVRLHQKCLSTAANLSTMHWKHYSMQCISKQPKRVCRLGVRSGSL
jgi:hypothetical protein